MIAWRYRVTHGPDGSTTVVRTDLRCLGRCATGVALVFGIAAIVALFEGQWATTGICLLLYGIFLPNFAKRRRRMHAAQRKQADRPPAGDAGTDNNPANPGSA